MPNNAIEQALAWAKGNKTYMTVGAAVGLGVYQAITGQQVPEYVYVILAAAGLGFHRASVADLAAQTAALISQAKKDAEAK